MAGVPSPLHLCTIEILWLCVGKRRLICVTPTPSGALHRSEAWALFCMQLLCASSVAMTCSTSWQLRRNQSRDWLRPGQAACNKNKSTWMRPVCECSASRQLRRSQAQEWLRLGQAGCNKNQSPWMKSVRCCSATRGSCVESIHRNGCARAKPHATKPVTLHETYMPL